MKGKLMKGFAGGSGGAGWEDKHLSPFLGGISWPFILWADRFLKPEVEKLINSGKTSVEKAAENTNFLFVVQQRLYGSLTTPAGSSRQMLKHSSSRSHFANF